MAIKKALGFVLLALALSFAKPLLGARIYGYSLAVLAATALGALLLDRSLGGAVRRLAAIAVAVGGLLALDPAAGRRVHAGLAALQRGST